MLQILEEVERLAGDQRKSTFRAAAEFIAQHNCHNIIETGCYRGQPADGRSTLILAMLAKYVRGHLYSFDITRTHVHQARELVTQYGLTAFATIEVRDSVEALGEWNPKLSGGIGFAYLDSYDHDASNPLPCQRHELAEIGAILGKMTPTAAILLDDADFPSGGKTGMGAPFLESRGWRLAAKGYQLLFVRP